MTVAIYYNILTCHYFIHSFSSKAGEGVADTWIRKEITNNIADLRATTIVTKNIPETSAELFLTCDLMNALAAVAEDINTVYFYRIEDEDHRLKPDHESLALLVVNTAIQFDECECSIASPQKKLTKKYCASWPGKSGLDWQDSFVHQL